MEELTSGLDPDELMDLDEPEGSDLEEDEEDLIDDHISSPFILSSAPESTANSVASSPISEDCHPPFNFTGKPLNVKRGRGRPRREGGKPIAPRSSRGGTSSVSRVRKPRPPGFSRRGALGSRSIRQVDRSDYELSLFTPSPIEDNGFLDPETGSYVYPESNRYIPSMEDPPYFPEHWPGKVCALCNLGERSQLGQGELLRLNCPDGFSPHKVAAEQILERALQAPDKEAGDKSPKGPVTCRRQKSFNKCRHPSMTSEYIDELTIIGYNEVPDVSSLFELNGQFYIHRNCALWSHGVTKAENSALLNVGPVVLQNSSKKCSFCSHYGASLACNKDECNKIYHFPCATASGAFQEVSSSATLCSDHFGQVALLNNASPCLTCGTMGDIANLMFCSGCGAHYHGICVGLAQLPGVRSGWQCRKCRCCQVCRVVGDESKLMSCEQCDKVYHAGCQRPIVTSIPKYGWKCRCCRVCGDCGARTPGAGLSSRWHAHYTVCDSCYQQRNKGFSCPLCHKAYRAHAHREMVQCYSCKKFVHGTCDSDADVNTYNQRKDMNPEYEYVCLHCKHSTARQITSKRASLDDSCDISVSRDSLYDDTSEFDLPSPDEFARNMGLGKGKPYSASKIAKKRLSFTVNSVGRPKGTGKVPPGKMGFMKRSRLTDFNRKRGHKAKMRGIFGVPGVGLQRPISDGKNDEEPGVENRLVLCSAKDKFTLTQDICVMCGAFGTDQEGCLIGCVQCGQCYHPYCINVKVTKVILQKGWRCLDCTVCEGCGQRNDEARLILCDDCDVSFHIYCMDPPLDYVPHGNWKCKWCAVCLSCGSTDPGFNCTWMNSTTQCGPCASHINCPSCNEPYSEGDLIIQCVQCDRWLHGSCDYIKSEEDAEKCAEEGYNCILCRPRDVPPPHLIPPPITPKPPTPTKSPEVGKSTSFYMDGVYLSEFGNNLIKSLALEYHGSRKKRKKIPTVQDKEAGIIATIESVVAGGNICPTNLDDSAKLELVDIKDEPQELYKEGMTWTKEDGPPPEGFAVVTMENGVNVLRRKRQRNLQKLGIGGFLVRMRGIRTGQDTDDIDQSVGQSGSIPQEISTPLPVDGDKPRRKAIRRKPKNKLAETFPAYLQEAFFGKDLMDVVDCKKEVDSCSSEDEKSDSYYKSINLSQDELIAVAAVSGKNERLENINKDYTKEMKVNALKEEEDDNTEDLKDVLALPGDLLDTDLVNSIMEDDEELSKNTASLEGLDSNLQDESGLTDTLGSSGNSKETKDELSDLLGPHFNLDSISNINSKDVEDIFKGVLTDESQESQESSNFSLQGNSIFTNNSNQQSLVQHPIINQPVRPKTLPNVNHVNLNSPVSFPPPSPYHSEYSNSPQFSPAFTESPSAWVGVPETPEIDSTNVGVPSTYNQRSSEKMKADESLGNGATISAVLYANINHPEWKKEFPNWSDRYKHIIKKWRTLSQEQKAPFLQHARDNRSQLRMKKAQQSQTSKESTSATTPPNVTKPLHAAPALVTTLQAVTQQTVGVSIAPTAPVSEVCTQTRPTLTPASVSSVSVTTPPPKPPSPTTHQQFTVHGNFAGPGDHVGPAPNVTVNPHYQPNNESIPHPRLVPQSNASDQQIRVLTPSEIMRTLPSLYQENYEPQGLDQEKIALQQKSAREAEQERQWKQLQALRQQQTQQQQNIIHEQRVQDNCTAIARVQRQISTDPTQQFLTEQQSPLQVNTPQELSPSTTPTAASPRQFLGIKSPTFPVPSPVSQSSVRSSTPLQSPHDMSQPGTPDGNDPFIQSPTNPKPNFQPRLPNDPFAQQPVTPRPQFGLSRPPLQNFGGIIRADQQDLNINRQLRDLLQRQQVKKLDEIPGKLQQQRVWHPVEQQQESEASITAPTSTSVVSTVPSMSDATFRQPLPPSIVKPRLALSLAGRTAPNAVRVSQLDPRMQGLDPRMRLILQHQQQRLATGIQQQFIRFTSNARPTTVEQYEQLLQSNNPGQIHSEEQQGIPRMPLNQASVIQRPQISQSAPTAAPTISNTTENSSEEGIPDNVTAELEKLEQETGTMVELQGVSDILGGLDDDDELLAEMGADFNILEYADPELEALTGGKTNILDLELEEEPVKKEKVVAPNAKETPSIPVSATGDANVETKIENNVQQSIPKPVQNPLPPTSSHQITQQQNIAQHTTSIQAQQQAPHPQQQAPHPQQQAPHPQQQAPHPQQQAPHPQQQAPHPQQQAPHPQQQQVPVQSTLQIQQIHQQMVHQVQQAAAQGRPMPPGSKMQTTDGFIGIVMANNTVQLQIPQNYQQRLLVLQQLQNQKLQMRIGGKPSRAALQVGQNQLSVGLNSGPPRMAVPAPPPPPPPYPGPPPPYPGNANQHQQTGLRMGPGLLPMGHFHPSTLQGFPTHPHLQRRPLLLEEQPLLLEDLLEQEKREQEKLQNQPSNQEVSSSTGNDSESALLSDQDFERLKADVFNSAPVNSISSVNQVNAGQTPQSWQQQLPPHRQAPTPTPAPPQQPTMEITTRVQMFNPNLIPAPPLPPENIITEQDKQTQLLYEQWLNHQHNALAQQLHYYETEVQKLRKSRKSLNSKQRQLRKSGNQLTDTDAAELQRISAEQAILQKHLESSRKQSRQHGMLIQEYRNKHPVIKQRTGSDQIQSPLGLPASSPIQQPSTSLSPMLSPSVSPMTQNSSPLNSPGPLIPSSPGHVQNLLQSPNSISATNMSPLQSMQASPMQSSPLQSSPRIGTPHSQSEESPGPIQSPSQVCLPPPMPRMTSPQHRRVVTSPVGMSQMRFINNTVLQQRVRMQSPVQNFQQKPGTPSPLNSPTSQQINVNQLQIQKQLQQQTILQQQQLHQQTLDGDPNALHSQRTTQLLQHRNFIRQQVTQQQIIGQPQTLTPQQHQIMLQQQKQLAQQQQQQIAQMNAARLQQQQQQQQQNNPPHSPMPPKSPMIMSPHSMPHSPMQMPPKSPMVSFSSSQPNPNSPAARSPAFHQGMNQPTSPITHGLNQPPSSPMPRSPMINQTQSPHMRRPPSASNSPAMPERPHSVENASPRMSYSIDHLMQDSLHNQNHRYTDSANLYNSDVNNENSIRDSLSSGGGNPNNPCNPIPLPPEIPRYRYFKLGLRGGAPMWGFGRGAKRLPTPPNVPNKPDEKVMSQETLIQKLKKESHLSKVSILKRKGSTSSMGKMGSLVSSDYNDLDDSSSTPPVTPPLASTSRGTLPKMTSKKTMEHQGQKESVIVMHSPDNKQLEMMDYDDDTNTVLSAEVSLSSVAQNDDDMVEIETLSQQDLAEGLASPLESDQIADEFQLFPGNMVVDMSSGEHYSEKEDEDEQNDEEFNDDNMHIVIRSPTTSDDEFIMQSKGKKYNVDVHHDEQDDNPESPEQEEYTEPPDMMTNYEESDVMLTDQNSSTPEDSISTKEDFEELIDEGSRKNNITKHDMPTKHIQEFHKYTGMFNYPKNDAHSMRPQPNKIPTTSKKIPQKISLVTGPIVHNLPPVSKSNPDKIIITQNSNVLNTSQASKVTSIILTHNSAMRRNILNVPKIVSTVSPAITIVSASTSQMASILPSKFTVPVISASAVRQLSNVKVIDKPSSSSLSISTRDNALPKKIFEDDSVSPDSSNCGDDKKDSFEDKTKSESSSQETKSMFMKTDNLNTLPVMSRNMEFKSKNYTDQPKKVEHLQVMNLATKDFVQKQRIPSPLISKTSPPVIIHNTPELKMTAQVIQETQTRMKITATTDHLDHYDGSVDDQKSVVISIPSPTPSQEQMLDNIAMQALENRRREFDSIEDVLDMIENITAEPPSILEENTRVRNTDNNSKIEIKNNNDSKEKQPVTKPETINLSSNSKSSIVPQLSPLSQPTDLTTNMANASQQLRTLLSSLQTTSTSSPTNVESVVKNFGNKISSSTSSANQPIVASRVIQQAGRHSPVITNVSTVIVPNYKQKIIVTSASTSRSSPVKQISNSAVITSTLNYLPSRTVGGIQLMPDHPKLPPVTSVQQINSVTSSQTAGMQKNAPNADSKKPSLTLTAMLQNQPAANMMTKPSSDPITAASLLGSPISLPKTGFTTSLVQAQPSVVVPNTSTTIVTLHNQTSTMGTAAKTTDTITAASLLGTSINITKTGFTTALLQAQPNPCVSSLSSNVTSSAALLNSSNIITSSTHKAPTSTTNLLHTQLTKVVRSKSVDDVKDVMMKQEDVKLSHSENFNILEDSKASVLGNSGCKLSTIPTPVINKTEDSQNVLLKKLLQNTACASTQSPPPSSTSTTTTVANIPKAPIRETSFVSNPNVEQPVSQGNSSTIVTSQQMNLKKFIPTNRSTTKEELLSPQTPRSVNNSQDLNIQMPAIIKKEAIPPPQSSPLLMPLEVKKEFIDESSQHSEVSDHSRSDIPIKEELESIDNAVEKVLDKEEIKKQKRRMYQQKRRQNQILNKELAGQPKKRPRKNSKIEEDYDTYIDGVLAQLRQLPPITVSEPVLNRNFGVVPLFGSGDMSKIGTKDYSMQFGELVGNYGYSELPTFTDFYSTKPYGDLDPIPEKSPSSTQRGFYDQEFPLIRFDTDEHKKFDMFCREDTPDSILSSSSPECVINEPYSKFIGFKLITDSDDEEEETGNGKEISCGRLSPVVPMIRPVPIKLKPVGGLYVREHPNENKENIQDSVNVLTKSKFDNKQSPPSNDSGHVTVTLTLTSSAAEDIMGVLRDLANILHIPAPTSYQIVERTTSPPSQKLGLYRTKGKDGKEGAPIDIQSILNGATKFCKHCDVIILSNIIRRKVSDLPFLAKDSDLLSDGEELFFCSSTCYMQFALMHRSPSISEGKAAEIINHLSQKDNLEAKQKLPMLELLDNKSIIAQRLNFGTKDMKREFEPMEMNNPFSYFARSGIKQPSFFDGVTYKPAPVKMYKNIKYKLWAPGCLQPNQKHKIPTDKEIMELLYRMQITVAPPVMPEDYRRCLFCQGIGDGVADGPARLLNFDVDKWVHLNCGLWSDGVYETVNGALVNVENALQSGSGAYCIHCNNSGATIRCFKNRCTSVYHLNCAVKDNCVFYKNKTVYCKTHAPKNEKDNELTTLSVSRRVYIDRDENKQVAAVMHHSDSTDLLRVGSLIFLNVGQLLPHQLQNFHTPNYIYPIGYKIIRFYWSMRQLNKRCKYICSIHELCGRPEFRVVIQEPSEEDLEFSDATPKGAWQKILDEVSNLRKENGCLHMFTKFATGEDLFGLTEPAIVRVLESMPGIETLSDYKFKYGRNPMLELPLAINPSGAARTEPRLRSQLHWKRPHTQRTTGGFSVRPMFGPSLSGPSFNTQTLGELACPYSKQFVHSKSSQYKKMKQEWRNNVYLARSKIQGLGLYAARDLEKHTMVIEYIGEIIRSELAESREKQYEAKNRGIYMFRLDEERVVDATLSGGLARYINHSCNPNCVAEAVEVDRDVRIIIFSKRRILRGEELAYDYKFDIEDDQNKISCMCGAPNCRKWMN